MEVNSGFECDWCLYIDRVRGELLFIYHSAISRWKILSRSSAVDRTGMMIPL